MASSNDVIHVPSSINTLLHPSSRVFIVPLWSSLGRLAMQVSSCFSSSSSCNLVMVRLVYNRRVFSIVSRWCQQHPAKQLVSLPSYSRSGPLSYSWNQWKSNLSFLPLLFRWIPSLAPLPSSWFEKSLTHGSCCGFGQSQFERKWLNRWASTKIGK